MIEILIFYSNEFSNKINENLSQLLVQNITDNINKLEEHSTELNIKVDYFNNNINIKVTNELSEELNTTTKEYNDFILNKQQNIDLKFITIYIASETLEDNSRPINNFKKMIYKFFKKNDIIIPNNAIDIKIIKKSNLDELKKQTVSQNAPIVNQDIKNKAELFTLQEPNFSFDEVIIEKEIKNQISDAIDSQDSNIQEKVFIEWKVENLQKHRVKALNFFGEPGTGKSMTAEAAANKLGKKILKVSSADIDNVYQGEAPKIVQAIFYAARGQVLFIDEADSLLSARLDKVSSSTDQSFNSVRSQILIELEQFDGLVIFATNKKDNYDRAMNNRITSIGFKRPSLEIRKKLWENSFSRCNVPISEDVDIDYLAKRFNFVGRDIRNAFVSACKTAANKKREKVTLFDFVKSCEQVALQDNSNPNVTIPSDEKIKTRINIYKKSKKMLNFGSKRNKKEHNKNLKDK